MIQSPVPEGQTTVKSPILEEQKRELKKEELGKRVLSSVRNELYLKLKYLDLALGNLPFAPGGASPAGTDGAGLYFTPDALLGLYQQSRARVVRLYLHSLFHCLFCHPFDRKGREEELWDLSCDVAAEALIDSLCLKCAHVPTGAFRKSCLARLGERLPVLTAEGIYRELEAFELSEGERRRWMQEFHPDDHSLWEKGKGSGAQNPNRKRWEDVRDRMQTEIALFSREASEGEDDLLAQLQVSSRPRYDYREFLRKFTAFREEMQADPDSFDYIFYHYGMSLYGNMPLIEPQETREIRRIEEFVIVIDTSMSCRGDLVQRFLEETYQVLSETESFFQNARIHILQCDERVQTDKLIQNAEELKAYMEHFTLKGGGGTDFRPAFAYVEERMAERSYGRVKGLLYFTDGYGIFPVKMPLFETAFVFLQNQYRDVDVPPWAIRLILGEEDLTELPGVRGTQGKTEETLRSHLAEGDRA